MSSSIQFLYQFTSVDILNTSLIDVRTGGSTYQIVTSPDVPEGSSSKVTQLSRSDETSAAGSDGELDGAEVPKRRTVIYDAAGDVVCEIAWNGRIPDITLGDKKVGPLKQLFGSTGVPFRHNALTIPSRFNADCVWTATPNSLVLYDHNSEAVRGAFHHNVVRPTKGHLIKAHIPGLGHNYLSFTQHDSVSPVEFILSFIMLEIVRRGRFLLTPYSFERPKHQWVARDLIMRRLRRSTI
ncbi:hypothetical protein BDN71DRAFT_1586070 [Pleurotus eryngii]|uniref:Uncharacterized protein n=1 Tax=Pleurotus eryngii TaxID=5323 RepID=A0A9P6A7S5_PLEER|nr:hypothetical protein BDN71DRAFT_1586070 [Pleurotus eryngii]